MKLYTIIGGVNGAGKSSLTGVLKAERSDLGRIIDVDKLAVQHGGFIEGGKAAVRLQEQSRLTTTVAFASINGLQCPWLCTALL